MQKAVQYSRTAVHPYAVRCMTICSRFTRPHTRLTRASRVVRDVRARTPEARESRASVVLVVVLLVLHPTSHTSVRSSRRAHRPPILLSRRLGSRAYYSVRVCCFIIIQITSSQLHSSLFSAYSVQRTALVWPPIMVCASCNYSATEHAGRSLVGFRGHWTSLTSSSTMPLLTALGATRSRTFCMVLTDASCGPNWRAAHGR